VKCKIANIFSRRYVDNLLLAYQLQSPPTEYRKVQQVNRSSPTNARSDILLRNSERLNNNNNNNNDAAVVLRSLTNPSVYNVRAVSYNNKRPYGFSKTFFLIFSHSFVIYFSRFCHHRQHVSGNNSNLSPKVWHRYRNGKHDKRS